MALSEEQEKQLLELLSKAKENPPEEKPKEECGTGDKKPETEKDEKIKTLEKEIEILKRVNAQNGGGNSADKEKAEAEKKAEKEKVDNFIKNM